jgi:hypothetical protein
LLQQTKIIPSPNEFAKAISDAVSPLNIQIANDQVNLNVLNGKIKALSSQIYEIKRNSVPRKLLSALGPFFAEASKLQEDVEGKVRLKQEADIDRDKRSGARMHPEPYFTPPCHIMISSVDGNEDFAYAIEAVAKLYPKCDVREQPPPPPPPPPSNADVSNDAAPIPERPPFITIRYPIPSDVPAVQGVNDSGEQIEEANALAVTHRDKMADRLMKLFQTECNLDARRSHKTDGDKWTIYVDLGKQKICE